VVDSDGRMKLKELADRISKENDPKKFSELIVQLHELLDGKDSPFKPNLNEGS
jgi:hypothetical protein